METIVEFGAGEEILVTLKYEGLKRLCSNCNSLTHSSRFCPQIYTKPTHNNRLEAPRKEENIGNINYSSCDRDLSPSKNHTALKSPSRLISHRPQKSPPRRHAFFNERVDRHVRPFGDRIPPKPYQAKPQRYKITPDLGSYHVLESRTPDSKHRYVAERIKGEKKCKRGSLQ